MDRAKVCCLLTLPTTASLLQSMFKLRLPFFRVAIIEEFQYKNSWLLKYLSPVGSMIKFLVTNFWILGNIKHYNHATFMNQQVVTENSIIEPTGDKYFRQFYTNS